MTRKPVSCSRVLVVRTTLLTAAMEAGVSPAECQDIGIRSGKAWIWEGRLKALAIEGGAQVPEDWKDQISEIREDIEEYEQEEA